MQHITKITSKVFSILPTAFTAMFAIALVFGLVGTVKVEAATQSTYMVDLTGNGCGSNCPAFYNYLASNGISVSSNNSNTTSSGSNTPSQLTKNTGVPTGTINYVQYPYYTYQYFQNPAPKYDSYLAGQYPETTYIYYGKDATEQMNKYKKTYTPITSTSSYLTNGNSVSGGSGFTITSILK